MLDKWLLCVTFFLHMSVKFANMWRHADLTNFFHLGILARKTFHKHWKYGLARKKCKFVSIWSSILFLNSNSARISYLYSKMLSWLTYFIKSITRRLLTLGGSPLQLFYRRQKWQNCQWCFTLLPFLTTTMAILLYLSQSYKYQVL